MIDFEQKPTAVGWYTLIYSWDPIEGSFETAAYWDGEKWSEYNTNLPICVRSENPFETKELAVKFGEEYNGV